MAHTVKQLAELSGVSVRTLHWYDEKNLLKPTYVGDNGYRYYEEAEILKLQQILFYKELGFTLDDIQQLLNDESFDKIKALKSHKALLVNDIDRKHRLIDTIEKTIQHLQGEQEMMLEDIFDGFTTEKQNFYEEYLVDNGVNAKILQESKSKTKNWSKEDWLDIKKNVDDVHDQLVLQIQQGKTPKDMEVQKLIDKHYQFTAKIWVPDHDAYIGLSQLYGAHSDFVAFYEKLHPKLLGFLQKAMEIYAKDNL